MDELLQQDVLPEPVAPEQEEHVASAESEQQPVDQAKPQVEEKQDRNWKQARQVMQEQKRQIDYLSAQLDAIRASQGGPKSQPDEDLAEDDYVKAKHLNRQLMALQRELAASKQEAALDRLRIRHTDFDEVVSEENIEFLKENEPELAMSLQALQGDPYQQGLAAYKMLKRTDFYMQKQQQADKKRVQENASKPMSVQAVRKSSDLADSNRFVNGLTPDLKKALQKEMAEARRRAY